MAWVKLREHAHVTGEALSDWGRGKMASHKIRRHWKFIDGFAMTVTGKIQKFRMREIAIDETELEQGSQY